MSKTRNQRERLRRTIYRLILAVLVVGLLLALALVARLWYEIETYSREYGAPVSGPIITLEMLPEDFDPEVLEAARQRYVRENHLEIPQMFDTEPVPRTMP